MLPVAPPGRPRLSAGQLWAPVCPASFGRWSNGAPSAPVCVDFRARHERPRFALLAGLAELVETDQPTDRPMTAVVCGLSAQPDSLELETRANASLADYFEDEDS